jgi:uncharacterized membrane protein (UPF0127 family)
MKNSFMVAGTVISRLIGMLNDRVCSNGEILMLTPCHSIHTYGMREALDIAFVANDGLILAVYDSLAPGRHVTCSEAAFVLERRTKHAFGQPWFEVGQRLRIGVG